MQVSVEDKGNRSNDLCASDHLLLHRHYSAWLRSTLADMDRKTETVLEVLVEKRETSISEIEMPNAPLIQSLISELRNSYHAIAEKCDSLLLMDPTSQSSDFTSSSSTSRSGDENVVGMGLSEGGSFRLSTWDEMRMSAWKLMEDNLRQQEELIRRNDINRQEIERLGVRLEQLDNDNAQLKQSLLQVKGNKKKRKHPLPRWISTWFKACFKFDTTTLTN